MAHEEKLIENVVNRLYEQVTAGARKGGFGLEVISLRQKYEDCLVKLSTHKCNAVSQGLSGLVDKLMKIQVSNDEIALRTNSSIVYVLKVLGNCLKSQWDHIKAQFDTVQSSDETEVIKIREKQEQIPAPPLEDALARQVFLQMQHFLTKPPQILGDQIFDKARVILKHLSASNYETVISPITQVIANPSNLSEEDAVAQLHLIEHLNLNARRLGELLEKCQRATSAWKKGYIQFAMARVLRCAIWNWMDTYPMEFVTQTQSGQRMRGQPKELFEIFDGWASNTAKKNNFWPVQTMLLILCPDVLVELTKPSGNKKSAHPAQENFLNNLKKSLKSSKLCEVACVCYVDICKACTYIRKKQDSGGKSSDAGAALLYIYPAVEIELKEKFFNPQSPFKRSDGSTDTELMTDLLLASFILNARSVMNSLFVDCLKPTSPPYFRVVLVECLLRLSQGANNLLWKVKISDVFPVHAGNLRNLFQECFHSMLNPVETSSKNKKNIDKQQTDLIVLTKLIRLIALEPDMAVYPVKSAHQDLEDVRNLMTGLAQCTSMFSNAKLSDLARDALLNLHTPENIAKWCPKSPLEAFWTISSSVLSMLATTLVENHDLQVEEQHTLVTTIDQMLVARNEYLQTLKEAIPPPSCKPLRKQAYTKLETALLVSLCSGKPEICSSCAMSFGHLCQEADILYLEDDPSNPIMANLEVYRQLPQTGVLSTGRAAQQKAIRSLLRTVRQSTQGNLGAWEEAYVRFQMYSQVVIRPDDSMGVGYPPQLAHREHRRRLSSIVPRVIQERSPTDAFFEWTNILGFLCSMSGVALKQEKIIKGTVRGKVLSDRTVDVVDDFIGELMELLGAKNIVKPRETVNKMLGNTLAPGAYSILFKHIHNECNNMIGSAGQINFSESSITFIEQAIAIIKQLIDSEGDSDSGGIQGMEDLILLQLQFIRQLMMSVSTLQIKLKFCGMLETLMERRHQISWKAEYMFRARLVENIMEWTSEFSNKQNSQAEGDAKQIAKMVKELDLTVIRACVSLLRRLPLPGDDDEAKKKSFQKFFNFFTLILTRCKKKPASVAPQLTETTIQALSSLVTANIEHGLEYFISMGYHEDFETRAAFLKVLTNILVQGAEFEAGDEGADKYYRLVELLAEHGMDVVLALADAIQITEADTIAALLVRVFEAQDKTMDLMKTAIEAEISRTEQSNTLFRRNSMATKLLAAFCKLLGRDYLKLALGPQLRGLLAKKQDLELDPTKLPKGQSLETNCYNLMNVSNCFLEDILNTLPHCPKQFRVISNFLSDCVQKKFPGHEHTVVAGFMFLRFLCPAIVAPDGFGVVGSNIQDKDVRRGLVLITKVLQNLANRVSFTKEPFMHCMNPWIEQNVPFMKQLLDQMATVPEDGQTMSTIEFTDEQKEEDIALLHWHLVKNIERVNRNLQQRLKGQQLKSAEPPITDRLTQLLAVLGPPSEPKKAEAGQKVQLLASSSKASNVHFKTFMTRNQDKDVTSMENLGIFFQHGKTKSGAPVLYYIAKKWSASIEAELLLYYILKTSHQFISNSYAVVIDLTHFGNEHFIQWAEKLAKIVPAVAQTNLSAVYILHPNTWFKKFSKRVAKITSRLQKKIVFCNLQKLVEQVPGALDALPASTQGIDRNVQATFAPVFKVTTQLNKKEVILKINTDLFQVITKKEVDLLGQSTQLYDIINISKVSSVSQGSSDNESEFIIKYDWAGEKSLTFRSPAAKQIIQQLKASKDRNKLSVGTQGGERRTFRASDVPGTLLNMALLNITSDNYPLRRAAYNLLSAVCHYFSFSIRHTLLEAGDVCLPRSTYSFVGQASKELARSEPRLTLEFLTESFDGLRKADNVGQLLVLDYIRPWFANLKIFSTLTGEPDSVEKLAKSKELLNTLIIRTINEQQDKAPAILSKVWKALGRVPETFELLIDLLLARAAPGSPGASIINTKNMNAIEDIVATLAAENARTFSGKLIHRLIRAIEQSGGNGACQVLCDHKDWRTIEILSRWLMVLSFNNLLAIEWYLAELLHIVIMLFFTSTSVYRASIQGLFVNIVHSLCTHQLCEAEKLPTLKARLVEFHQIQFRLQFGLSGMDVTPYSPVPKNEKREILSMHTVENVANSLLMVLNCCTPGSTAIGTTLHARWLSLTTAIAVIPNPALQPRAIMTLGVLCQTPELVTEEIVGHLLSLLQLSLVHAKNGEYNDLAEAVVLCLSRMFEHLRPTSKFFRRMFWLAAALLQIKDIKLFGATTSLLETVLKILDDNGCFRGYGLSAYCMNAREGALDGILSQLDQTTGVSFKQSFSFAVAAHILKGLRSPSTKTQASRLLTLFVELCKENTASNMLGYLAALLPMKGEEVIQHLRQTIFGSAEGSGHSFLFSSQMVPDRMHAALLFTFLATFLKNSESEHEQRFIFNCLVEGVNFMPEAFPVTFDILVPKMTQVVLTSQNPELLDAVFGVKYSIFEHSLDGGKVKDKLTKNYLLTIGFGGLPDLDQFDSSAESNQAVVRLVSQVVDGIQE